MELGTKIAFAGIDPADQVAALQLLPPPPRSWRLWGVAPLPNPLHAYGGGHAVSNFTAKHATNDERLAFQAAAHSTVSETADMLRLHMSTAGDGARLSPWQGGRVRQLPPPLLPCAREHLFQKVLTPSDVGNLNRLVVPKQHAEKHLFVKRNPLMAAGVGVLLDVKDGEGKTWRFRYSYCWSSRIYILTKGWRRFVREKGLQAGDTVAFSRSAMGPYKQMHIDYWRKQEEDVTADAIAIDSRVVMLFGVDIARRGSPELRSS